LGAVRNDRIVLTGMVFHGRHGALPAERELGQRFTVDVELEADLRRAGTTDRLADTVNYVDAYEIVGEIVDGPPLNLLEAVAERIAGRLLELPGVARVTVRVHKRPPLPGEFHDAAVEVTRGREG
jgi:7,8-dihydroneopterin aldolase/epimerase/oxygenase